MRRITLIDQVDDIGEVISLPEDVAANICRDELDPEIVFVREAIYKNSFFDIEAFHKLYNPNRIFVQICGEAFYPDLNLFDYAISRTNDYHEQDRVMCIPVPYISFRSDPFKKNELTEQKSVNDFSKRKFCSFIYSHGNGHPNRDFFFHRLSAYKKVDSLGPHLNNMNNTTSRNSENWLDLSIQMKHAYKFDIAFENTNFNGCTSEKIMTAFRAHTIPIYWGNPHIAEEFNSKAFINCHDYSSFDQVIEKVIELDQNEELYLDMLSQPWQTEEQIQRQKQQHAEYEAFLRKLIDTPELSTLIRRPQGFFTDIYRQRFFGEMVIHPGERLILYGTIKNAADAVKYVENWKGVVVALCNSKAENQGKQCMGKPVISPKELLQRSDYGRIIITSSRYYEEIKDILLNLGIEESRIGRITP